MILKIDFCFFELNQLDIQTHNFLIKDKGSKS